MFKPITLSLFMVTSLISTNAQSADCDISGIWNHSAKPAKLSIDLKKGEIFVYSHENNSKAVGAVVIKSLALDSTTLQWKAKMYSAADDSFVDVNIIANACSQLNVSYRGEEVLRLIR
ncbi:hypothetical protein [Thalassotalea maritima]|uniref:hypothetical protein n=1 Tax=Thalassotalea maritima TaxID=3242416 RepID=UPI003527B4EC